MKDPHAPVRLPLHDAFGKPYEMLQRQQHPGWFVEVNILDGQPNRFFLTAWKPEDRKSVLASTGFWHRNREAREHIPEFLKALAAMLVILAPMLIPGGGL